MKKAIYHTEEAGRSLEFDVLKTNSNGTVDLGLATGGEDGKPLLVVGSCKVTETETVGACVMVAAESTEEKKPKGK